MQCNVGPNEQLARLALGCGTIGAALMARSRAGRLALGTIGLAELYTGLTRYCPMNALLGVNNCAESGRLEEARSRQPAYGTEQMSGI